MKRATLALVGVLLVACGPTDGGGNNRAVSDSLRIAMQSMATQRDEALNSVHHLSSLVSQIDSEVADVRDDGGSLTPSQRCTGDAECTPSQYAQLRAQVAALVGQLAALQMRLRAQAIQLQASIDALTKAGEQQVMTLDSTRTRVGRLAQDSARNAQSIASLTFRVDSAAAASDSVFVIAAPKADLIKMGAAVQRGGTILAFGLGKTLVALPNPPVKGWMVLSKKRDTVIVLPRADRWYGVVSAHPLSLLRGDRSNGDLRAGTLHIGAPNEFWATSRYLVLEQR